MSMSAGLLRLPRSVLFGRGAVAAAGRVVRDHGVDAFVVTDRTLAQTATFEQLFDALAGAGVRPHLFDGTAANVPLACVDAALGEAQRGSVDVVVGFGGGSCIDVAKATALLLCYPGPLERYYGENAVPGRTLPVVAIPTTAGTGSEVSPVAVIDDPGRRLKVGVASPHLVPAVAICDPIVTRGCPPSVTAFAGADALVHAVEAFTAARHELEWHDYPGPVFRGKNPLSDQFALTAISRIGRSLERAVAVGDDLDAREDMLFGSLCAGIAFAHAGTAAAHALQYPIGSETDTPHGLGVALLAPYVLDYVAPWARNELAIVADVLGVPDAIDELHRVTRAVGIPNSLGEIGVDRGSLAWIAESAAGIERLVRNSPRPLAQADLRMIAEAAYDGARRRQGVGVSSARAGAQASRGEDAE